jgi:hypothetical protein
MRTPLAKVGESLTAAGVLIVAIDAAVRAGKQYPALWPLVVGGTVGGIGVACALFAAIRGDLDERACGGVRAANDRRTEESPQALLDDEDVELEQPDGVIATVAKSLALYAPLGSPEILMRGPTNWLLGVGSDQPEVTLRVLAAVPRVLPLMPARVNGAVSPVKGEARERVVREMLESSPLSVWLHEQCHIWHWDGEPRWEVHGNSNDDLTEVRFVPTWPTDERRLPFLARFALVTGSRGRDKEGNAVAPALQAACDVMINVLELDGNRKRSSIRHQTTTPPAPGALQLEEVVGVLRRLWAVTRIANDLAMELVPAAEHGHGEAAMWLLVQGQQLGRVIDLRRFPRLPDASDSGNGQYAANWSVTDPQFEHELAGEMAAEVLNDILFRSGYRDIAPFVESVRSPTAIPLRDQLRG